MPNVRTLARSFSGGEISPEMFGRVDLAKFQTGLARALNFEVLPHGPSRNRAGTQFVRATKFSATKAKLIPFSFNTQQTFALEFGQNYIRFHTNGATLESSPGAAYEVATPYLAADVFDIHYVQSADVLTLVHPNYPPKELRRLGPLSWTLTDISFVPQIAAPTGLNSVTGGPGGGNPRTHQYVVTAVNVDSGVTDESLVSNTTAQTFDLTVAGNAITLNWTASVSPTDYYNVYRADNGVFGFIGQANSLSFVDDNVLPDSGNTPPSGTNPFVGATNYPSAVTYYEQRRAFAATLARPQNIWMTRSGTESNFTQSIPTKDDDAVLFRIAAREVNQIRHLVPLATLVVLTASAEWRIQSSDNGALAPSSVSAKPQSYTGCNNVQPVTVGSNILFARARGGRVSEFSYGVDNFGSYRYQAADLSLVAPHLFQGYQIMDMAMAKAPYQILWAVSSSGMLLGCTYVSEQQVAGWHKHDTHNGSFESVCTVGEGDEDAVYLVVKRTINGQSVRYVERMHSRAFATQADAFFVDAGARYVGAPITVLNTGLSHLEGETVSILADGGVLPQQVVSGGTVTLDFPASTIQIGLPILAQMQLLPMSFETAALGQGRTKNVNKTWLRLVDSLGLWVGPTFDEADMTELKPRIGEPWGTPPSMVTGELEHLVDPLWGQDGQVCIEMRDPLPATIAAISYEVAIGS